MKKHISKEYIHSLIERMNDNTKLFMSSQTIAWKAYREAEKLNDRRLFPILKELISAAENKSDREKIYVIFGNLLRNINTEDDLLYYIQRLTVETDKHVLSTILDKLSSVEIPEKIDISTIITHSQSCEWLVRHAALSALGSSCTQASRDALLIYINQTDEKKYKFEIMYANASMGRIGTPGDIPALEKHIQSNIADIKDSALFAIQVIRGRFKY